MKKSKTIEARPPNRQLRPLVIISVKLYPAHPSSHRKSSGKQEFWTIGSNGGSNYDDDDDDDDDDGDNDNANVEKSFDQGAQTMF